MLAGADSEDVVRTDLARMLAGTLVALVSGPPMSKGKKELYISGSPPAHIRSPHGSGCSSPRIAVAAAGRRDGRWREGLRSHELVASQGNYWSRDFIIM